MADEQPDRPRLPDLEATRKRVARESEVVERVQQAAVHQAAEIAVRVGRLIQRDEINGYAEMWRRALVR